jgi:hypothetical protein
MERANGFLSWSTADARIGPVADVFKAWVSSLFQGEIDFFLSREVQPGEPAIPAVYGALNSADFGFIFLSQRTARSPWVIFESGCLNPSLRAGKVFPLLFDLTPRELRDICPPLADFQAISLTERDGVRRLVDKLALLVGLGDGESIALKARFHDEYPQLERAIRAIAEGRRVLPDRFSGMIAYNDSIAGSRNFQIPEVFTRYEKEMLLVGNNLNFLLNLRSNPGNFSALLDSLTADPMRRIKILISDLWDREILRTYDRIVFGYGISEFAGLNEVFTDAASEVFMDSHIRNHVGDRLYGQLRKQLMIKKIGMLVDTFWFVDPDDAALTGDMLFALMTTMTGRERPVFYVNQHDNPRLFAKHFDTCRAGFDLSQDILWPN